MWKFQISRNIFSYLFFVLYAFACPHAYAQNARADSLLKVLATQKEDTSKANTYYELSRIYLTELNDIRKVAEYGWKELALAQSLSYKKGIAQAMTNIATSYRLMGNYDLALYYDRKSLALMQELKNMKGESTCLLNIGLTHSERYEYREALEYMKQGLKMKQQLGDRAGIARAFNNLANVFYDLGNYTEALKYHLNSLHIKEELNDKIGIASSYNNIGNVMYSQKRYDEALSYYTKCANYQESVSNYRGMANAYHNIGTIYADKHQYKEALDYHSKALNSFEKALDKMGVARSYNSIGTIHKETGKFQLSLNYQQKSYELFRQLGNKKGLTEAAGGVGMAYEALKDHKAALQYYNEMLQLAKTFNSREGIRDAYGNLASVYEKQNEYEKALQYTQLYTAEKDSLLNKENFKQVSELNTRYETDKKEKEILLLTKDQQLNTKIIRQQQMVRWGLIGGLALLSISIFSIYRRYHFKQKANIILEKQKEEIEQKNVLITDSIDYAQTIQEAVLPTKEEISELIPDSFIFYKPKATVSGDFYWVGTIKEHIICAVADCTGHGVPGAFMSLLGYNMLENVVKDMQLIQPASILDALNAEVINRLAENESQETSKHGMDISLISFSIKNQQLQYAGAHNSLYIVRDQQLIELKADKMGIGGTQHKTTFHNQTIDLKKGDMIYLFTDGFPDQIGGPKRKKFYYAPFKELLIRISTQTSEEQQVHLNEIHKEWMSSFDQTDDILIIGIRI